MISIKDAWAQASFVEKNSNLKANSSLSGFCLATIPLIQQHDLCKGVHKGVQIDLGGSNAEKTPILCAFQELFHRLCNCRK